MKELLKPTTTPQGTRVVSARNLYEFLGIKTEFSKWCTRMFEYGFTENVDYVVFAKNDENSKIGRPTSDYALTLDTAKEIAMIQRTEKGKEARQYFIQCEKELEAAKATTAIAVASPLDLIQLMLDQAKAQEQRIVKIESFVDTIKEERNKATEELLLVERSTEAIPEETTRMKIRKIINQYCQAKNADYQSVWHVVYDRLYYRYGVNIRSVVRKKNESVLDVAERLGHLEKIYAICSSEFV